jgi:hypothetical protein
MFDQALLEHGLVLNRKVHIPSQSAFHNRQEVVLA